MTVDILNIIEGTIIMILGIIIYIMYERNRKLYFVHKKTGVVYLLLDKKENYILQSTETGKILKLKVEDVIENFNIKL